MSHSYTIFPTHCVWGTKGRNNFLVPPLDTLVYKYIVKIVSKENVPLIEIGGTCDHVHLLLLMRRPIDLAGLVRIIKSRSSRFVREHSLGGADFAWQMGYGAFAVSASQIDTVKRYIQNQEQHHKSRSFENEYFGLLDRHGIGYNKRDVFGD